MFTNKQLDDKLFNERNKLVKNVIIGVRIMPFMTTRMYKGVRVFQAENRVVT